MIGCLMYEDSACSSFGNAVAVIGFPSFVLALRTVVSTSELGPRGGHRLTNPRQSCN